jgi:hypothetical protein
VGQGGCSDVRGQIVDDPLEVLGDPMPLVMTTPGGSRGPNETRRHPSLNSEFAILLLVAAVGLDAIALA